MFSSIQHQHTLTRVESIRAGHSACLGGCAGPLPRSRHRFPPQEALPDLSGRSAAQWCPENPSPVFSGDEVLRASPSGTCLLAARLGFWETPGAQHKHSSVWCWHLHVTAVSTVPLSRRGRRRADLYLHLPWGRHIVWGHGKLPRVYSPKSPRNRPGEAKRVWVEGTQPGWQREESRRLGRMHLHVRAGCAPAACLPKDSCDSIWG